MFNRQGLTNTAPDREEYLDKRYEVYAQDFRLGKGGVFFTQMMHAMDDGLTECNVFTEYEHLTASVYDSDLEALFEKPYKGKPSLRDLLCRVLSTNDFQLELTIYKNVKIVATVSWSL